MTRLRCQLGLALLFCAHLASDKAFAQTTWHVGDRVEAGFMGSSYTYKTGVIIEARKDSYKVHFDGYTASYDDWVPAARVKMPPAAPTATAVTPPAATPPANVATTAVATPPPTVTGNALPVCQIGMVVRAGALNYDAKIVEHIASSGLYKVQYVTGYKGDIEFVGPAGLKTCSAPALTPVATTWFVGVWQLFTGGGGAWQKNPTTNSWKVVGLDAAGAPPIRISANGTYEWVIDQQITIVGQWRVAAESERKYGYEKLGTTIVLLKGESDKNWLVSRQVVSSDDGRDRILIERTDLGLTYRGNRVGAVAR